MDGVFGLRGVIADRTSRPELADSHVAIAARKDFKGDPLAVIADDVLITFIRWSGQATLDEPGIEAVAPRALATYLAIA